MLDIEILSSYTSVLGYYLYWDQISAKSHYLCWPTIISDGDQRMWCTIRSSDIISHHTRNQLSWRVLSEHKHRLVDISRWYWDLSALPESPLRARVVTNRLFIDWPGRYFPPAPMHTLKSSPPPTHNSARNHPTRVDIVCLFVNVYIRTNQQI